MSYIPDGDVPKIYIYTSESYQAYKKAETNCIIFHNQLQIVSSKSLSMTFMQIKTNNYPFGQTGLHMLHILFSLGT